MKAKIAFAPLGGKDDWCDRRCYSVALEDGRTLLPFGAVPNFFGIAAQEWCDRFNAGGASREQAMREAGL